MLNHFANGGTGRQIKPPPFIDTSLDGNDWTTYSWDTSGTNTTFAWGCDSDGDRFVFAVHKGDYALTPGSKYGLQYSDDLGQTWTHCVIDWGVVDDAPADLEQYLFWDVAHNGKTPGAGGAWIAVVRDNRAIVDDNTITGWTFVLRSTDGINWTYVRSFNSNDAMNPGLRVGERLIHNRESTPHDKFMLVGNNGNVWTSVDDGLTWSRVSHPYDYPSANGDTLGPGWFMNIAYGGNHKWLICDVQGSDASDVSSTDGRCGALYSYDNGVTWNEIPTLLAAQFTYPTRYPDVYFYGCGYSQKYNVWILQGYYGEQFYSSNLITWHGSDNLMSDDTDTIGVSWGVSGPQRSMRDNHGDIVMEGFHTLTRSRNGKDVFYEGGSLPGFNRYILAPTSNYKTGMDRRMLSFQHSGRWIHSATPKAKGPDITSVTHIVGGNQEVASFQTDDKTIATFYPFDWDSPLWTGRPGTYTVKAVNQIPTTTSSGINPLVLARYLEEGWVLAEEGVDYPAGVFPFNFTVDADGNITIPHVRYTIADDGYFGDNGTQYPAFDIPVFNYRRAFLTVRCEPYDTVGVATSYFYSNSNDITDAFNWNTHAFIEGSAYNPVRCCATNCMTFASQSVGLTAPDVDDFRWAFESDGSRFVMANGTALNAPATGSKGYGLRYSDDNGVTWNASTIDWGTLPVTDADLVDYIFIDVAHNGLPPGSGGRWSCLVFDNNSGVGPLDIRGWPHVLTSLNGADWSLAATFYPNNLVNNYSTNPRKIYHNRVQGANALWVALVDGGGIWTSPDGLTWTHRANPYDADTGSNENLSNVVYGDGTWIVVSNTAFNGTTQSGVLKSTDGGVTWTDATGLISGMNSWQGLHPEFTTILSVQYMPSESVFYFVCDEGHIGRSGAALTTMSFLGTNFFRDQIVADPVNAPNMTDRSWFMRDNSCDLVFAMSKGKFGRIQQGASFIYESLSYIDMPTGWDYSSIMCSNYGVGERHYIAADETLSANYAVGETTPCDPAATIVMPWYDAWVEDFSPTEITNYLLA